MAKETLLESDINDGAELVQALDKNGEQVQSALWFLYPDLAQWKLLIVSAALEKRGPASAYARVSEIISSLKKTTLSIADVKIINAKDPMMQLLKGIARTNKGIHHLRFTSDVFNGIYVQDALVYRNA